MRDLTYTHPQALSKKGKRIEDPQIVAWANSKVEGSKIRSFGDPSLSTGVFLLQVRTFTHQPLLCQYTRIGAVFYVHRSGSTHGWFWFDRCSVRDVAHDLIMLLHGWVFLDLSFSRASSPAAWLDGTGVGGRARLVFDGPLCTCLVTSSEAVFTRE